MQSAFLAARAKGDTASMNDLLKKGLVADVFVGGCAAISESGDIVSFFFCFFCVFGAFFVVSVRFRFCCLCSCSISRRFTV